MSILVALEVHRPSVVPPSDVTIQVDLYPSDVAIQVDLYPAQEQGSHDSVYPLHKSLMVLGVPVHDPE